MMACDLASGYLKSFWKLIRNYNDIGTFTKNEIYEPKFLLHLKQTAFSSFKNHYAGAG